MKDDKTLQQFADLMIKKIKEINADWKKPWFSINRGSGLPQNLSGRIYGGMNSLMLYLWCDEKQYQTPVFMTFTQAREEDISILKGEKSFPIVFWKMLVRDEKGKNFPFEEYQKLDKDQQKGYSVRPYMQSYRVFNVEQTSFSKKYPERWQDLKRIFKVPELKDEKGMFVSQPLDAILSNNRWVCPIESTVGDSAYYALKEDKIYLPLKSQFHLGERFYGTMLHEMAHSTGNESRLNREIKNKFGDSKYAKEELVAEFTAAVVGQSLGILSTLQEGNASYLKNWLNVIDKEPQFLYSILSDVGKATAMILEKVRELEKEKKEEKSQEIESEFEQRYEVQKLREDTFFRTAVIAAHAGNLQVLKELKDQGYLPERSEKEIIMNGLNAKIRGQIDVIFQLEQKSVIHLKENRINDNANQQLSLNF